MADRSCAAIIQDDAILMVRQTYKGETIWTFPGGRLEYDETPSQCAIRETKEETGLEIEISGKVCEFLNEKINGMYYCYLGGVVGGTLQLGSDPELSEDNQELADIKWFPIHEMKDHPEDKRLLAHLQWLMENN
jgi:ADP-ribose pyrophosphatase